MKFLEVARLQYRIVFKNATLPNQNIAQDVLFSQKLNIECKKSFMKVVNFGFATLFLLLPRPKNCKCLDIMVFVRPQLMFCNSF